MNTDSGYPYRFQKHPAPKGICPQCGHTNVFRYYEDLNYNRLDEDLGRCERTNSCGYHIWPTGKAVPKTESNYTPPPEPQQIFPTGKVLNQLQGTLTNQDSPLHAYCASIGISYEHLAKWRIGTESVFNNTYTVFVHEDIEKRLVNAKWVRYNSNGRRIKGEGDSDKNSFSLKQSDKKSLKRYGLCLFGEHLLDPDKKRAVMIVESEKTAVIASWFYSKFDWVATGSANGLTDAKISVLFGRRCYWLCDADGNETKPDSKSGKEKPTEGGRHNSSIRKLKAYEIRHGVLDLFPGRKDGYDIADAIHDAQAGNQPPPELLDPHQQKLIVAMASEPQSDEPALPDEPTEHEEPVEWENQVGLPPSVWADKKLRKHFRKYGFIEHDNAYWFATKPQNAKDKGDTWVFRAVSNFIVDPLLLIKSKSDPKRIYKITNNYGAEEIVDLDPEQFTNLSAFRKTIASKGNYVFFGTATYFSRLIQKLFELSKEAQEIKTLGYHPDGFYAFGNGIQNSKWVPLDENGYGIVEHDGKRYFLPAMSKIYLSDEGEYQNQKLFINKVSSIDFTEYARQFCDIYQLNGNGRIGLLFYITCLFRDIVFGYFRFFPHLFLFGPPQTGKSSLAWSMMYLFGEPRPPFMLNTGTSVAFYKQFAEFRNAVVWFDEYQNSIDYGRVQSLKTAYDGAGHTKSDNTKDNRNKSIPVHSGCVVSGQELPTADNALFTRCILLQFPKTDFTMDEKNRYSTFNRDVEQAGVSHLTAYLTGFRAVFNERFIGAFDSEFSLIKKHFEKRGIDDRIAKNVAILLATYQALKDKLEFPFGERELRETAYALIGTQSAQIGNSKETSVFWTAMMYMQRKGDVKDKIDYRVTHKAHVRLCSNKNANPKQVSLTDADHPTGKPVLFIKLGHIHSAYEKYCRERGQKSLDQDSLRHYLTNSKEFIGNADNIKFGVIPTTALAFDYKYLTETVSDFGFYEQDDANETNPHPSSDRAQSQPASLSGMGEDDDTPF